MEIERLNDHTVKFFITYRDIENRGFDREEIWYNRERSEELFWEMMDEAHYKEEFPFDGPLWIQVQALEKGLEIIVTKAQMSQDGQKLELPMSEDKQSDLPVDENIEKLLDQKMMDHNGEANDEASDSDEAIEDDYLSFVIGFKDFEDVISLSHAFHQEEQLQTSLYALDGTYYLHISFSDESEEKVQDDMLSQLLEFGFDSGVTIHRLQEYGREIVSENALQYIRQSFSQM